MATSIKRLVAYMTLELTGQRRQRLFSVIAALTAPQKFGFMIIAGKTPAKSVSFQLKYLA